MFEKNSLYELQFTSGFIFTKTSTTGNPYFLDGSSLCYSAFCLKDSITFLKSSIQPFLEGIKLFGVSLWNSDPIDENYVRVMAD